MGEIARYQCEKCGYRFSASLGVGFDFPRVYAETVEKMKSGKLGEEAKRFFDEHPDGAINCEDVIMQCEKCGEYDSREALTMYVPKEGHVHKVPEGIWSVAAPFTGQDYVSEWELEEGFTEYADYPHKCETCGGNMRIIASDEPIVCPHCGEEMAKSLVGFWD